MEKQLEKVEITYSDGTHETYDGNVLVIALEEGGIACRASFRCKVEEAGRVAMTMVIEAGKIFAEGTKQEGEEHMWSGKEESGFDFLKDL